jgi:hypothetical protein
MSITLSRLRAGDPTPRQVLIAEINVCARTTREPEGVSGTSAELRAMP